MRKQEDSQSNNNSDSTEVPNKRRSARTIKKPKEVYSSPSVTNEEERLIRLAIKNSMLEVKKEEKELKTLDDIEPMKVFRPTEEEFTSPIEYVEKLYKQGASKFGTVKIVPPPSFRPPLAFD